MNRLMVVKVFVKCAIPFSILLERIREFCTHVSRTLACSARISSKASATAGRLDAFPPRLSLPFAFPASRRHVRERRVEAVGVVADVTAVTQQQVRLVAPLAAPLAQGAVQATPALGQDHFVDLREQREIISCTKHQTGAVNLAQTQAPTELGPSSVGAWVWFLKARLAQSRISEILHLDSYPATCTSFIEEELRPFVWFSTLQFRHFGNESVSYSETN